jgi:hypothetical protein
MPRSRVRTWEMTAGVAFLRGVKDEYFEIPIPIRSSLYVVYPVAGLSK